MATKTKTVEATAEIELLRKQLEELMKENEKLRAERSRSIFRSDDALKEALRKKGYPTEITNQIVQYRNAYLYASKYALISFKPYNKKKA